MRTLTTLSLLCLIVLVACGRFKEPPISPSTIDLESQGWGNIFQDSFQTNIPETWPENGILSQYGSYPYNVLFDGVFGGDGVRIAQTANGNRFIRLTPQTQSTTSGTHASLVSTSLNEPNLLVKNRFWFQVTMRTIKQLRSPANAWERAWLVWGLKQNQNEAVPEAVRKVVPYKLYYFYVKDAVNGYLPVEVGKIEPDNQTSWNCFYDVTSLGLTPNIDCDNDGQVNDVIFGAQRFFHIRTSSLASPDPKGDCLLVNPLPEEGFPVGASHTFRISQKNSSFDIYWVHIIAGKKLTTLLLSCSDKTSPYLEGGLGFYTEDADVMFDNFSFRQFQTNAASIY